MTEPRFDEVIHAPLRLRICGLTRHVDAVGYQRIVDTLEVSPAVVSKHLKVLTEHGYVKVDKTSSLARSDSRKVAWVSITDTGRDAFDGHVAMLRQITQEPAEQPARS